MHNLECLAMVVLPDSSKYNPEIVQNSLIVDIVVDLIL